MMADRSGELPGERCESREVGRMSTPGWVPPASRGTLASRQSNARASRQSNSRGGEREREARRRPPCPGGNTLLGRQRLSRSAPLSLPTNCFNLESAFSQGNLSLDRPSSPDSEPERQCSIDDETAIPKGLFDDFLKAGKEARSRGQHFLDRKKPGCPHLVNSDQPPPGTASRSLQREAPPALQRAPPCGHRDRDRGVAFWGMRRTQVR